MKKYILLIGFLLIIGHVVYGQSLIKTSDTKVSTLQRTQLLNSRIAVTDIESIDIDLEVLREKQVRIAFLEVKETIQASKTNVRDIKNFSWIGKSNDQKTHVILSVMGNDIQGIITHHTDMYRIETLNKQYLITRIDQSNYPDEGCYDDKAMEQVNTLIKQNTKLDTREPQKIPDTEYQHKISGEPFTCKVRVLVLYTSAADSLTSNILNTIQLAVDETNASYENSDIDTEIELVYAGPTNYTEVSYSVDVYRFASNGEGYMDEVHALREQHQADICVLIEDVFDYCGVAIDLLAYKNTAFCTVDWDCATGYYTFGHEIGHLIGAQHAPEDVIDPNHTASYPYAHGYKSPDNEWRTIMAYNCPSSCIRLPYWSNPSINHPTDSIPMGIVDTCDNARMIREHHPTMMSLLQPATTLTIDSIATTANQGDIIAINSIITNDTVQISNEQAYSFRASNTICLKPGFEAAEGCDFVAELVDVATCGTDTSRVGRGKSSPLERETQMAFMTVYPNPTSDHLNVSFSLDKDAQVDIVIYDFLGKRIQQIGTKHLNSGTHQQTLNVSTLSNGIYFIAIIQDNGDTITQKIIKQ